MTSTARDYWEARGGWDEENIIHGTPLAYCAEGHEIFAIQQTECPECGEARIDCPECNGWASAEPCSCEVRR